MNKFYKLLLTFFLLSLVSLFSKTLAQTNPEDPRFTMTVKNIHTTNPGNPLRDSILRFEVWVQQTNQGQAGINDLEYGQGQFAWTFNPAIRGNGNLIFGLGPANTQTGGLPPALRPPSFSIDIIPTGLLRMSGNLPSALVNFFISGTFPGTRIFTAQLRTTSNRFQSVPLNLRFKLGDSPSTFLSYFLPYPDTVDSDQFPAQTLVYLFDTLNGVDPVYSVENGGFVPPPSPLLIPVANFYANSDTIYSGFSVSFTDSSLFSPTSWIWSFPGGSPSTSTLKNPNDIFYNSPGTYLVTLIAANLNGSDTITKNNYVTVIPNCISTWKNTIVISDAGEIKDSLIFGTSPFGTNDIDSCHAERILPILPPPGVFDVRFLLNNIASKIDIRKDSAEDKTWTLQFQPSPAGYPITFAWDTNAFSSTGYFFLKDLGGSEVNINMRNQNNYTLSNSEISILKIEYTRRLDINLKIIPEGLYSSVYNLMSRRDTFSVYLRNITAPFTIVDSSVEVIDSISFNNIFTFQNTHPGSYYIVVKHFNSLETWSAHGGINISTNQIIYEYNFTEAIDQAFGNNMKLKGDKYCLYTGDIDQNGFIDLTDLLMVFNDSKSFLTGRYLHTDLNGDSIVDLFDITLCRNNSINFIRVRRP